MQKYLILLAAVLVVIAVMFGCDDRGSGVTSVDLGELENWNGVFPGSEHVLDPALYLQLRNSTQQLLGSFYVPPASVAVDGDPVPTLVLLAPETGNRFYYFKAGMSELVRELTASGQIQPMIIYCMSNDQTFGGFFYGNSYPAGLYDDVFAYDTIEDRSPNDSTNNLIRYIHAHFPTTIRSTAKRGIGGIGEGAYGAFRAMIQNPGVFSSISVADGPLDFDGASGSGGLTDFFDEALAEEENFYYTVDPLIDTLDDSIFVGGTPYDDIWVDTDRVASTEPYHEIWVDTIYGATDTTYDTTWAYFDSTWVDYDTIPFSYHRDFDSSLTMPLSMMYIGGSFAFSPNDTLITYTRISGQYPPTSSTQYPVADGSNADTATLIRNIVKPDYYSHYIDMDFMLPFDSTGGLYAPVWERWMANNLDNLLLAQGGDALDDVQMFFATNANAKWNYAEMTQSWIAYLKSQGLTASIEEYPYSSYHGGEPVVHDEYLFDVLREMLIFHSNNFNK